MAPMSEIHVQWPAPPMSMTNEDSLNDRSVGPHWRSNFKECRLPPVSTRYCCMALWRDGMNPEYLKDLSRGTTRNESNHGKNSLPPSSVGPSVKVCNLRAVGGGSDC
jgi:hypothetical protein